MLEAWGDSFPYAAEGVSWDRLTWHGLALLVLLGGFYCFVRAFAAAWRTIRGDKAAGRAAAAAFDDEASETFDPDAALARYLEKRAAPAPGQITRPRPGGFGKRGL